MTTFVEEGYRFKIKKIEPGQPEAGRYVADIWMPEDAASNGQWARVLGFYASEGEAITAAKYEIEKLTEQG